MTLDEFFAALKQTPRQWVFLYTDDNRIRYYKSGNQRPICQCPVTMVHGGTLKSCSYLQAAAQLGLAEGDARDIATAADLPEDFLELNYPDLVEVRRRLIDACEPKGIHK